MNPAGFEKINDFASKAVTEGYSVYGMTSSTPKLIKEVTSQVQPAFTFYTTDEITLKTMIRSNPGLMLIKEGVVIGKWHFRNIPSPEALERYGALSYSLSALQKEKSDSIGIIVVLLIGLLGLTLYFFRSDT